MQLYSTGFGTRRFLEPLQSTFGSCEVLGGKQSRVRAAYFPGKYWRTSPDRWVQRWGLCYRFGKRSGSFEGGAKRVALVYELRLCRPCLEGQPTFKPINFV